MEQRSNEFDARFWYGSLLIVIAVALIVVIMLVRRDYVTQIAVAPASNSTAVAQVSTTQNRTSSAQTTQPVASSRIQQLDPEKFRQFLETNPNTLLIDVHTPEQEHIDGTDIVVPYNEITSSAQLPDDKNAPIAVYCRTGNMSTVATQQLEQMGYTNIAHLAGGKEAWDAVYEASSDAATNPTSDPAE